MVIPPAVPELPFGQFLVSLQPDEIISLLHEKCHTLLNEEFSMVVGRISDKACLNNLMHINYSKELTKEQRRIIRERLREL
jgi:hypothetical protein